jgi:hypothetical protein
MGNNIRDFLQKMPDIDNSTHLYYPFLRLAEGILTECERDSFAVFVASNPQAGSVVRGSGGVRKVR